jgi:threonine 3-dehydrogenase
MGETKMKALEKKDERKGFYIDDIPVPQPKDNEILVKVKTAAICGSDMKLYKWTPWCKNVIKSLPFIPGHEGAGEVVKVGTKVAGFKLGDRVAAETHIPCGICWQCTHDRPHTCLNMGLFGHTVNGCFAEYFTIPETAVWKLSVDFPLEKGCLLEPMGIPLRAVYEGDVAGDSVVVIGCGPIGQFAIGVSKVKGAERIIAIDINDKRLEIADQMGATHLLNPNDVAVTDKIHSLTDGNGAGVVIEASGDIDALHMAFEYIRIGGKIFTIGHPTKPLNIDISTQITLREVSVRGLFGRELWKTWEIAESLILLKALDPTPIVTHTFSLEDFNEAFKVAESGEGCKIVFLLS